MKSWSLVFYSISFLALVIVAAVRINSFGRLREFAVRADHTRELVSTLQNISISLKSAQLYSPTYEKLDAVYYRMYKSEGLKVTQHLQRLNALAGNKNDTLARFAKTITSLIESQLPVLLKKNVVEIVQQKEAYRLDTIFRIESSIQHMITQRNNELAGLRKRVDDQMYNMRIISLTLVGIALAALVFGIRTNIVLYKRQRTLIGKLRDQRQQLELTNQRLEKYVYAASHDFQEPLRKIIFFADMLKEETSSPASQQMIGKVIAAAQRMAQLIKDTLQLSAVRKKEGFAPVDLNLVLADVLEDLEISIRDRDAAIRYDRLPYITCSAVQVRQLFVNLISNALKFKDPDRELDIDITCKRFFPDKVNLCRLDPDRQYFEFIVKDNGIGFNTDKLETIFDMFVKLHQGNQYKGSGIGLALCKQVVVNHAGCIWAERLIPFGAAFHVILPANGL